MGDRASDFLAIALCEECHRGNNGFHGTKAMMKIAKVSEMDLLAETIRLMDKKEGRGYLPSKRDCDPPTDSKQENAVEADDIREGQTIQPRDLRRKSRAVRSGQTFPA